MNRAACQRVQTDSRAPHVNVKGTIATPDKPVSNCYIPVISRNNKEGEQTGRTVLN